MLVCKILELSTFLFQLLISIDVVLSTGSVKHILCSFILVAFKCFLNKKCFLKLKVGHKNKYFDSQKLKKRYTSALKVLEKLLKKIYGELFFS